MTENAYARRFEPHPTRTRIECEMCGRSMWLSAHHAARYRTCGDACRIARYEGLKARELTRDRLLSLLRYDPETGAFFRIATDGNAKLSPICSVPGSHGYLQITVGGRAHLAHRLAWFYMTGEWPEQFVDHRDTDKLNNRWSNLRQATQKLNNENRRRASKCSKTGLIGVRPAGTRFAATIKVNYRSIYLGRFDTPEAAHAAYVDAKRKYHEGCTL